MFKGVRIEPVTRLAVLVLFAGVVLAADPFYLGRWRIESASVAPWWNERQEPDTAEMKGLTGKTVAITPTKITGPRQLGCSNPRYVVKEYPADMLFQGMFGEMHERDRSVDPAKVAARVGFRGTKWKTVETGCGNELDFHFLDESTFAFGLNNYIYLVRRQP